MAFAVLLELVLCSGVDNVPDPVGQVVRIALGGMFLQLVHLVAKSSLYLPDKLLSPLTYKQTSIHSIVIPVQGRLGLAVRETKRKLNNDRSVISPTLTVDEL